MKTLEQLIEEEVAFAVQRIVRQVQHTAMETLESQFLKTLPLSGARVGSAPDPSPRSRAKKSPPVRRSAAQITELSDRFLQAVRSDPGQSMSVLAPRLGVKPGELTVPVARLKASKMVKSVGNRHLMRYFPVSQDAAA
jgi:hypothetical protein